MGGMTNWDDIRRQYGAALARVVASYAPPGPDREELAQDVALAVLQALPRHRGESSLKTYVLRIAHNVGLRQAVRRRARRTDELSEVADTTVRADHALVAAGERSRLHVAIRQLPMAQRQVLALALEELTHGEISQALDISENAVATRLHRAKAQLRLLLEGS